MSEIKTDKLTGTSTAGSILVTGEGNSTTTNLQQGLAKAWNRFAGGSVPTFLDSLNNSTATDNGAGDYTFAFTNNMNNANYAPHCGGGRDPSASGVDGRIQNPDQITTSNYVFNMFNLDSSAHCSYIDDGIGLSTVHGDLA